MMRKLLTVCLISLLPIITMSQNVDSSSAETMNEEVNKLYQDLANAKKDNNKNQLLKAIAELGEYYSYRNSDSTLHYGQMGLEIAHSQDDEMYPSFMSMIANYYFDQGEYDKAIEHLQPIYDLYKSAKTKGDDLSPYIDCCSTLGVIYRRMGDTEKAISYYQEGIELARQYKDYDSECNLFTSIAILYSNNQMYEEGLEYVNKAIEIAPKGVSLEQQLYANSSKAAILTHLQRLDEAEALSKQSLILAKNSNSPRLYLKNIIPLVIIFYKNNKKDSVLHYMDLSEKLMQEMPDKTPEAMACYENQAIIYRNYGLFEKSLEVYRKLLNDGFTLQGHTYTYWQNIGSNYADLKQYKLAYEASLHAFHQLDSIQSAELTEKVSEMNVQYQSQEKEIEISHLKAEKAERKIQYLSIILFLIVCVFVLLLAYRMIASKKAKMQKQIAQQKEEFNLLKTGLDSRLSRRYIEGLEQERSRLSKELHDGICNDLLAMSLQVGQIVHDEKEKTEINSMLQTIRGSVRSISHALMPPTFQNITIIDILQDLCERMSTPQQQIIFTTNNHFDWSIVSDNIAFDIYRIVQETLSNIHKYASSRLVEVSLYAEDDKGTLTIYNEGHTSFKNSERSGIGSKTVADRIQSMNASYKEESSDEGVTATIFFNLKA